ncbi:MAG: hypothetical protein ACE5H4_13530 [Candidatus Thorarchaeota archaeon]
MSAMYPPLPPLLDAIGRRLVKSQSYLIVLKEWLDAERERLILAKAIGELAKEEESLTIRTTKKPCVSYMVYLFRTMEESQRRINGFEW